MLHNMDYAHTNFELGIDILVAIHNMDKNHLLMDNSIAVDIPQLDEPDILILLDVRYMDEGDNVKKVLKQPIFLILFTCMIYKSSKLQSETVEIANTILFTAYKALMSFQIKHLFRTNLVAFIHLVCLLMLLHRQQRRSSH